MVSYRAVRHEALVLVNAAGSSYAEFYSITNGVHPAAEGIPIYAAMAAMRALLPIVPFTVRALSPYARKISRIAVR